MKNRISLIVLSALFSFCAVSCEDFRLGNDFLDKPISTDINIDTIFAHKKYADQVLAEVYLSMPDFMAASGRLSGAMLEILTDLGDVPRTDRNPVYYSGTVTAATQVKTIMAFHYTQMLRYYGGMPWVGRLYQPDDDFSFPRMTIEEHVRKVVELCDEAAAVLPWSVSPAEEGHMTAASALAIKNRILHFAASPLFNSDEPFMPGEASDKHFTWWGNYDRNRWQTALDAALELLERNTANGDYYQLVNTGSPRDDFRAGYYDRGMREALVVSHRYTRIINEYVSACNYAKWGYYQPTNVLADEFEKKDGTKFDWEQDGEYPFFDKEGNETRDPRLYETLWVNEDMIGDRKVEIYEGGREDWNGNSSSIFGSNGAKNGIVLKKFLLDYSMNDELNNHYYQCPHIRLSEIYLNIAEAMNELGIAGTRDRFGRDAYDYVNLVEFAFEEVRYFDISRRKRKDLLERKQYRLMTYRDRTSESGWRYDRSTPVTHERVWVERWSDRYYLLPLPVEEINKGYGLVQNPGW